MIADTLVVDGETLTKIQEGNFQSEYYFGGTTRTLRLLIRHQQIKDKTTGLLKNRHNVELTWKVFATPTTLEVSKKSYLVFEQPESDPTIICPSSLMAVLVASSNAVLTKVANRES